jgi:hypothetical protein
MWGDAFMIMRLSACSQVVAVAVAGLICLLVVSPAWSGQNYGIGFATYLGGSGGDRASEVICLPDGSLLIGGQTASADFPVTPGAFQTKYGGEPAGSGDPELVSGDCFLTRLSADGARVVASTFFGGSKQERSVYGMDLDSRGNVVFCSLTRSRDLPATPGAYQTAYAGGLSDIFAAKISGDLKRLIWCTYIGGSHDETPQGGLALDSQDDVYIVGSTDSKDFPTTPDAYQTRLNGGRDAVIVRLKADGSDAVFSTFLGGGTPLEGPPVEEILGVRVDRWGSIQVAGQTNAHDFPTTPEAPQKTPGGGIDMFIATISNDGKRLLHSTYWGGAGDESVEHRLAMLSDGSLLVSGSTVSQDFPTTPRAFRRDLKGLSDGFLVKLAGNHAKMDFSTLVGGSGTDRFLMPTVDSRGNIWMGGYTSSKDFPVTADAIQKRYGGGATDAVLVAFSSDGSALLYATYLGGSGDDGIRSITFGPKGKVYIVGETSSKDFPVTRGAFQAVPGGESDAFVVELVPQLEGDAVPATISTPASLPSQ